jgi:flagellar basal body-associated protein FliL
MEEEKKEEPMPTKVLEGESKEKSIPTPPAKKNSCCLAGIIIFIILLILTIVAFVLLSFKGKDWIMNEFDKANKEVAGVSTETS